MRTVWVLVANSSCAQVFEIKGYGKTITKLKQLEFPSGRQRDDQINTDRQGMGTSRFGSHTHSLTPEVDTHEKKQQEFANHLVEFLEKGRNEGSFEELALVVAPQFLGKLNHAIPDALRKLITKEINKDLPCSLSEQETVDHLCKYLDLWNR